MSVEGTKEKVKVVSLQTAKYTGLLGALYIALRDHGEKKQATRYRIMWRIVTKDGSTGGCVGTHPDIANAEKQFRTECDGAVKHDWTLARTGSGRGAKLTIRAIPGGKDKVKIEPRAPRKKAKK